MNAKFDDIASFVLIVLLMGSCLLCSVSYRQSDCMNACGRDVKTCTWTTIECK